MGKEVRLLPDANKEIANRLVQLEAELILVREKMDSVVKENKKMKEDLRFFELMLMEEYHMLLQLLGQDHYPLRIHSIQSPK